jgi:hypothetical protein
MLATRVLRERPPRADNEFGREHLSKAKDAARYPALAAWRRELAAGSRTTTTFDDLWRAACAEAWAEELAHTPGIAASHRRIARAIIRRAARRVRV